MTAPAKNASGGRAPVEPGAPPMKATGLLKSLGPGLVTGAADDDPSGIATYSQVGAQFGFGLAWTMLFSFPLMAGSMPERLAPTTSETADHSLPYIVARAMIDGTITTASYAPDSLRDPKAASLRKLITVREDASMTALVPKQSPNSVTVTLEDGRVVSERVDDLPGFAGRPMSRAEAEAKFERNAKAIVKPAQIQRISDAVWNLEAADSIRTLIESLVIVA